MAQDQIRQQSRRRPGLWAAQLAALTALACATSGRAAPASPLALVKMKPFALSDVRYAGLSQHQKPASTQRLEASPGQDADPASQDLAFTPEELFEHLLLIHRDVGFVVNRSLANLDNERMTLGVKFVRSF